MRLLIRTETGKFSLTKEFTGDDVIPRYAILSHTWGADDEEVDFEDMTKGTGENKHGYKKIQFCGEQAWKDGLQYFWIDTCCINKANHAELSEAINSMFRWYQIATKCYVYLSDVSINKRKASEEAAELPWEPTFRGSKWFTRGWTLQELLAPTSVEFFSKEWKRLGDKRSLRQKIHKITRVPELALQGAPLSQFSVNERLSWKDGRHTKLEEDRAYSLLGIFGVYIPPIYGEGTGGAFKRLMDEIGKLEKCFQDLYLTNPCDDKKRIEDTKGGLLEDSYRWILENSDFQQWREDQQSRLLWIKGDPGKGKTMLLCGIINELEKSMSKIDILSYFFCQATDSRINHATAILRGLLYLLLKQQPSLVSHVRIKHDHAGKTLFEDVNAWTALCEIFTNVLRDPALNNTCLIIDALDECVTDLPKLLDFIVHQSPVSSRVKWIVSSRNWPGIEERLERAWHKVRLCLELTTESVSAAVSIFIQHKVSQLAERKKYDDKIRDAVLDHLSLHADGTFLWIALVCQNLDKIPPWKAIDNLSTFPPGLDSLYERMIAQICSSDGADLYKQILASIAVAYRPITLKELTSLVVMLNDMADDLQSVQEIIGFCGSFLTVREGTIYFVHQSVKDFIFTKASDKIFPTGKEEIHYTLFSRSLHIMSRTLRRDLYGLGSLGYRAEQVAQPAPDPLAASRYSCIHWVDHLCDWNFNASIDHRADIHPGGPVDKFIRKKYLYWLEALSLCKNISKGVVSVAKLNALIQAKSDTLALTELVQDALRFVMYHKSAIENSPLQVYISALIFSPVRSLTRGCFQEDEPKWIKIRPAVGDKWSACLQTLEGHSSDVTSVAFSHDSTRLASSSWDSTVKIWDMSSGTCLQTLKGHSSNVTSVAFSHDSTRLASSSWDCTVKIWDVSSGTCLQTLEGHSNSVISVAFSHDSTRLVSLSCDSTVKIWDVSSSTCLQTLEGESNSVNSVMSVNSVAFSHDSTRLALVSWGHTVKIWDVSSGTCLQTLKGHSSNVTSVAFSHDSTRLVSSSWDCTVKIWDVSSGTCLYTLEGDSNSVNSVNSVDSVNSVAFSHDSTRLALLSWGHTVKIWDMSSGTCLQTLEGHSSDVTSVAFSHDSTRLASSSWDSTVKIWDVSSGTYLQTPESHSSNVTSVAFSHNSTWLASSSRDHTVKIWDVSSGTCLQTLKGHSSNVTSVAFSHDSTRLASSSWDSTVKIWDMSSGTCLQTLKGHSSNVTSVAFSHDSTRLALLSRYYTVKIWDVSSGTCLQTLEGHSSDVTLVAFSHDSTRLASSSWDSTVKIWDVSSGTCLQTLEGYSSNVTSVAFSHDSTRLASSSRDYTVKIWDISSSTCLQTLKVDKMLNQISFDTTGSYLYTEIGTINISATLLVSGNIPTFVEPQSPIYQGLALSPDMAWITYKSEKLWLPSEYRPSCSAVVEKKMGIGVGTGRVWIFEILA